MINYVSKPNIYVIYYVSIANFNNVLINNILLTTKISYKYNIN